MRSIIVLLMLFCFYNTAKTQQSSDEKAIIKLITPPNGTYWVCSDEAAVPAWIVDYINPILRKDTTMHLNWEEITEVLKKLQDAEHASKWKGTIINNIRLIKRNDFKEAFGDSVKIEAYVKKRASKLSLYTYLQVSKPVFIRNNTICFIYYSEFGSSFLGPYGLTTKYGSMGLLVLIKKNEIWLKEPNWGFIEIID